MIDCVDEPGYWLILPDYLACFRQALVGWWLDRTKAEDSRVSRRNET